MKTVNLVLAIVLSLLLISCDKEKIEDEKITIHPYASFHCNDKIYNFEIQELNERWLLRTSLPETDDLNVVKDSILLEYETVLTGTGGAIYLTFNKKFPISGLENNTQELEEHIYSGVSLWQNWPDYYPSDNEFDKIFEKGNKTILPQWAPMNYSEGISIKFGKDKFEEMEWASFNRNNDTAGLDKFQNNSYYEIEKIEIINSDKFQFTNDIDYHGPNFVDSKHYLIVEIKFNIELYNEENTDTLFLENGIIKLIVHN